MDDFQPMKRGDWGFPALQKPEQIEAQAQKNNDLRDAMDDEGDMLTIAWLDGFHRGKEKRPWVGLTDEEIDRIKLLTFEKEINADGEEQEAVNLDQLIRAAEQLCKEKNHG